MIEQLKTFDNNIIALEIVKGFTQTDEKMIRKLFEQKLEKSDHVNLLIRLDEAKLTQSSIKAFFKNAAFWAKEMKNLNRIAVVGDSQLLKSLVPVDNFFYQVFNSDGKEKYFNTHDLEAAYDFLNRK